jgi:hypothetical protein
VNAETDRPKPALCVYCRHLQTTPDTQEALVPQAWCRLWQILIPEPATTGCTEFAPRGSEKDEGDEGVRG